MKQSLTFKHKEVQCFKFGSNPLGKPKMFSHIYYVDGLMIDTGHSNMQKEIFGCIKDLPVEQLFITHHHEDHTGNLAVFQAHFSCQTYSSPLCAEIMKNPPNISPAQKMTWGNRPANFNLIAKEGSLQTPNYSFEIIPIPGHAADMVCLYEANKGWLFSADLWVSSYIKYFMRAESMQEQIESIRKVLKLDFNILFCSHNPQFENAKNKLERKLQFFEAFYEKVSRWYHKGLSPKAILSQMGLKSDWQIRLMSLGELSTLNMIRAVVRDEEAKLIGSI